MDRTGYEPLNTLKPVADGIWLVDGPAVKSYGFPFSTRATVVRLENGDLWIHSPTQLTDGLGAELLEQGPVRHLIAPNQFHFVHAADWQAAFSDAVFWAAPGAKERAAKKGLNLPDGPELQWDRAEHPWTGQVRQMIVRGSNWHREAVFFHESSRTLILTDLIEALETRYLPARFRPFAWTTGIDDSDGKMPPIIRWSYRDKDVLAEDIEKMIGWGPTRVILSHGRWYECDGVAELERAFRRILYNRKWDRVLQQMDQHKDQN